MLANILSANAWVRKNHRCKQLLPLSTPNQSWNRPERGKRLHGRIGCGAGLSEQYDTFPHGKRWLQEVSQLRIPLKGMYAFLLFATNALPASFPEGSYGVGFLHASQPLFWCRACGRGGPFHRQGLQKTEFASPSEQAQFTPLCLIFNLAP